MVVWGNGIAIPVSFLADAEKATHLLASINISKEKLKKEQEEKEKKMKSKSRLSEEEKKKINKEKKRFKKEFKDLLNVERAVMRVLVRTARNSVWPGYTGRTLCALPQGLPRPPFHNQRIEIGGG